MLAAGINPSTRDRIERFQLILQTKFQFAGIDRWHIDAGATKGL